MLLEVGECVFDIDFTKDKLFLSQSKTFNHEEEINDSYFEMEQHECFIRMHYLSKHLMNPIFF